MKVLIWFCLLPLSVQPVQNVDISKIRAFYQRAPENKPDAVELNHLMLRVDSNAMPLLVCYKGANEMIQAKYALNPITKLQKFNNGKALIQKALSRDGLNLEMRFIRYSIQSNLPAFLGYRDELESDKQYLLNTTKESKDKELKEMIFNYLSAIAISKQEKQINKN